MLFRCRLFVVGVCCFYPVLCLLVVVVVLFLMFGPISDDLYPLFYTFLICYVSAFVFLFCLLACFLLLLVFLYMFLRLFLYTRCIFYILVCFSLVAFQYILFCCCVASPFLSYYLLCFYMSFVVIFFTFQDLVLFIFVVYIYIYIYIYVLFIMFSFCLPFSVPPVSCVFSYFALLLLLFRYMFFIIIYLYIYICVLCFLIYFHLLLYETLRGNKTNSNEQNKTGKSRNKQNNIKPTNKHI